MKSQWLWYRRHPTLPRPAFDVPGQVIEFLFGSFAPREQRVNKKKINLNMHGTHARNLRIYFSSAPPSLCDPATHEKSHWKKEAHDSKMAKLHNAHNHEEEPGWPRGKALGWVSGRTPVRLPLRLTFLFQKVSFMDTVSWLCPRTIDGTLKWLTTLPILVPK